MRAALGLAVIGLAMMSTAEAAQTRLATEKEFAELLLGCWGAGWEASLVNGGHASGTDLLCFDADGIVSTESEISGDVKGRYTLAEQKLHFVADEAPHGWMLGATKMSCDATIQRNEGLTLRSCRGQSTSFDGKVGPVQDFPDQWYFAVAESDK